MSLYNYSSAQNIQNKCYYSGNNIINRIGDSNKVDKSIKNVFEEIGKLNENENENNKMEHVAHVLMSMISNGDSFESVNKKIAYTNIKILEEDFVPLKNFIQQKIKVVTNWSYLSGNRILSGMLFSGSGYNNGKKWDDNLSKNDKMNIEKFMIALNHMNSLKNDLFEDKSKSLSAAGHMETGNGLKFTPELYDSKDDVLLAISKQKLFFNNIWFPTKNPIIVQVFPIEFNEKCPKFSGTKYYGAIGYDRHKHTDLKDFFIKKGQIKLEDILQDAPAGGRNFYTASYNVRFHNGIKQIWSVNTPNFGF